MENVKQFIEQSVSDALSPAYLEVVDESYMHSTGPGAQSHFKLTVVSDAFEGQRLIARHRTINSVLTDALNGPVHALALHTFTPHEWQARGHTVSASPACLGGSKKDQA